MSKQDAKPGVPWYMVPLDLWVKLCEAWDEMLNPTLPSQPIAPKIVTPGGSKPYLLINGFRYAPADRYDSAWLLAEFSAMARKLQSMGSNAMIEVFAIELTMLVGLFENGVVSRDNLASGKQDEDGLWMSVKIGEIDLPLLVRHFANLDYREFWLSTEGTEERIVMRAPNLKMRRLIA